MTWLLRGLALVFALGAIVAGLIGYRLSSEPPPPPPQAPPTVTAVRTLKPLTAGEPIRAEDITLASIAARPAGSFESAEMVVGQKPAANVAAGEILTKSHLRQSTGQFQELLRSGERAIAIKVDEVVGLGGFAQPGDRVDILLYLRGAQETANASSAQVVLSDVRLLAFGDTSQAPAGQIEEAAGRLADKTSGRSRSAASAVLAVPEAAASRLMLAANSGNLRLSLRPAGESTAKADDSPYLIHLATLA
ncbi:MAG TPA: Flp pilus assembly protein CpaB, partial [Rhodocyclaceae bacterium]|nr:Flp pilus assembly protein CpaB [Rhodocyclaceae bacterium]